MKKSDGPITFTLSEGQRKALAVVSGGRRVRLSGSVAGNKLVISFIACNAPFVACNAPFSACNAPFVACNAPFAKSKR